MHNQLQLAWLVSLLIFKCTDYTLRGEVHFTGDKQGRGSSHGHQTGLLGFAVDTFCIKTLVGPHMETGRGL